MLHNIETIVCAEYSTCVSIDVIRHYMQNAISFLYPSTRPLNLSILVTNNKNIAQLNNDFRGIPESTDVLSFAPNDSNTSNTNLDVFDQLVADQLGDIVISYEEIRKQSLIYKQAEEEVLSFLLIHGLLHLSGYDHATSIEKKEMQKQETALLHHLNISSKIVAEMYDSERLKG